MVRHKMDHLACFIPGMLALGAHARAVTGDKAHEFLEVAEELGETCWQMYDQMPTGAGGAGPPVVITAHIQTSRMWCSASNVSVRCKCVATPNTGLAVLSA